MNLRIRKKPVVIDAFKFTGDVDAVIEWKQSFDGYDPRHYPMKPYGGYCLYIGHPSDAPAVIASPGDYIIRDVDGNFFPCSPDAFENDYERIVY